MAELSPVAAEALAADARAFREERAARLAAGGLPFHALAAAIYAMASARPPGGAATRRALTQAADVISFLADQEEFAVLGPSPAPDTPNSPPDPAGGDPAARGTTRTNAGEEHA